MHPLASVSIGIVAPGKAGKARATAALPPAGEVVSIVALALAMPGLGLGWILSYSLLGPSTFLLAWVYLTPVDVLGIVMSPPLLLLVLAGLVVALTWFLPVILLFAFTAMSPAARLAPRPGRFRRFLLATIPSYAVHLLFIIVVSWLVPSGVTFFHGMRTVEDSIFTIALVASLGYSLASMTIAARNARGCGILLPVLGIATYIAFLALAFWLLFS